MRRYQNPARPTAESPRSAISRPLLVTELVTVGRWWCPVDSPFFHDSGPAHEFLCVFPRTGVWIRHDGHLPFVADPSIVTYYSPGQHYERAPIDPSGDRCDWYALAPRLIAALGAGDPAFGALVDGGTIAFTHGPSDRTCYLRQRAVFEHVSRVDALDTLYVEETMADVIATVFRRAAQAATPGLSPQAGHRPSARDRCAGADLAEAARAILAIGYAESWSLDDLARQLGTSPFHLARVFRRYTGSSLHAHRTELRMRAALDRLTGDEDDLTAIALGLGFCSHSHFTQIFHKTFGATPTVMRNRLRARLGTDP